MRWNCTVECRPFGSVGKFYERITVIVWSLQRSQAVACAIAGAVGAGWKLGRVIECQPIFADEETPESRVIELEAALRDLLPHVPGEAWRAIDGARVALGEVPL